MSICVKEGVSHGACFFTTNHGLMICSYREALACVTPVLIVLTPGFETALRGRSRFIMETHSKL